MLAFKACMMGWRVVRLMALGIDQTASMGNLLKPSIYTVSAQIVLARIMDAVRSQEPSKQLTGDHSLNLQSFASSSSFERSYLDWTIGTFSTRDTWPSGSWMVALFRETGHEVG